MKAWWSTTRPNGAAIDAGTFCRVIDLEDGTHPIYTYGATMDEVLEKIERQNGNAQIALARRNSSPPPASQPAPQVRPRMNADEVMQATTDLQNPAKSGPAIARLVEDATGLNLMQIAARNMRDIALEWEDETPEFYQHNGNRRLVGDLAVRKVNGQIGSVTKAVMTQAFNELRTRGELFERPETVNNQPSPTPSSLPAESQVQPTERPRRFSTGMSGPRLRAAQTAPPRTLKYTERQILAMPLEQSRELLKVKDPDYLEAVAVYEARQMAS